MNKRGELTGGDDISYDYRESHPLNINLNSSSLPSSQAWTQTETGSANISIVTLNNLGQYKKDSADFIRFNDDTTSGQCFVQKNLTAKDISNLYHNGGILNCKFVLDSVNGVNGCKISLVSSEENNPLLNGKRGFILEISSENGFLKINSSLLNGESKNPVIKLGDYVSLDLLISKNLESSRIYVNGRRTNCYVTFDVTTESSGIIFGSGSFASASRVSYLEELKLKEFAIDMLLSNNSVLDNIPVDTVIGGLSMVNADGVHSYSMVIDPSDKFKIVGTNLVLKNTLDYETSQNHLTTISSNLNSFRKNFTINVIESLLLRDTFSSPDSTTIFTHTGEHGYSWLAQPFNSNSSPAVFIGGRVRGSGANNVYYLNYPIPSPNYRVKGIFRVFSTLGVVGVTARASNTDNTYYIWRYRDSIPGWELLKRVSNVQTMLATFPRSSVIGEDIEAILQCKTESGITTITGFINGVPRVSVVDNSITAAGRAGMSLQWGVSNTTGLHISEFAVELI